MKAIGIVILFPMMSVLILSLYVQGGTSRTAAVVLLVASLIGAVVGLVLRRKSVPDQ